MMAGHLFSNKELKKLILPLFMEQLLVMLVGIADTFVVSYAGEAAVSGVSLVNSLIPSSFTFSRRWLPEVL